MSSDDQITPHPTTTTRTEPDHGFELKKRPRWPWIAGGAVEPGDMQLNLGTCGVLGVIHQSMDYLNHPDGLRMVNIPYTTAPQDTFAAVSVTTTGGQA